MTNVAIEPVELDHYPVSTCSSLSTSHVRYQGCLVKAQNVTTRRVYHYCSRKVPNCVRLVQQLRTNEYLVLLNCYHDVSRLIKQCDNDDLYSIKPFDKDTYQVKLLSQLHIKKL